MKFVSLVDKIVSVFSSHGVPNSEGGVNRKLVRGPIADYEIEPNAHFYTIQPNILQHKVEIPMTLCKDSRHLETKSAKQCYLHRRKRCRRISIVVV